jgi:hydroxyacylglutathione hydrolase
MKVRQIAVGPMANFVYLAVDEETRKAVTVDSGWETEPIIQASREEGANILYVIATHQHFDHVSTVEELASKVGAEVVGHRSLPIRCDRRVEEGSVIQVGGSTISVLHTPGHTQDSICLLEGTNLFTGDTLFIGTVGRFQRGTAAQMFASLERLRSLPDRTLIYPGHDYGEVPFRTIGEEKRLNPALSVTTLDDFVSLFC